MTTLVEASPQERQPKKWQGATEVEKSSVGEKKSTVCPPLEYEHTGGRSDCSAVVWRQMLGRVFVYTSRMCLQNSGDRAIAMNPVDNLFVDGQDDLTKTYPHPRCKDTCRQGRGGGDLTCIHSFMGL